MFLGDGQALSKSSYGGETAQENHLCRSLQPEPFKRSEARFSVREVADACVTPKGWRCETVNVSGRRLGTVV